MIFSNKNKNLNSETDKEYQLFLKHEKIKLTRLLSMLGFLLYGAFLIVDYWALKSALSISISIRLTVISFMLLTYWFTYHSSFIRYYSVVLTSNFIIAVSGVEAMVYLAIPSDHAYTSYFAGLMIVLLAMYSWTYLKASITSCISILVLVAYIGIEFYAKDMVATDRTAAVITNIFFLGGSIIFGFFAQVQRDNYLRQNFFLQRSLKDAYDKKSEEASDNEYLANHDSLTDLPNRRYMMELLNQSLDVASQKDKVLVIMFIDLNGFKQINDVYGHNAGDEVLIIVAKRLELAIRQGDHLSRLGGDEYLLGLMMEKENLGEIEAMANKFVDVISQSMNVEGLRVKVGASIGIAAYPIHGNNVEALINIADHKMYQVKKGKDKRECDTEVGDVTYDDEQRSVVIFPGSKNKNRI